MDYTTFHNIINGDLRSTASTCQGIDPSTEEKLYDVPCSTEEDVNEAVISAQRAFPAWASTAYGRRCELVREYAETFLALEEEMTELLMRENGKPVCRFYLGLAMKKFDRGVDCDGVCRGSLRIERFIVAMRE